MNNWLSVLWGFLLFQPSKVLEVGKGINRSTWERNVMYLHALLRGFKCKNAGKKHFIHLRNAIYHFWPHGLRCSKSFLQFLFVLNSCCVHSSNPEQRVLNQVAKAYSGVLRFQTYTLSLISLSFLFLLLTLSHCCSRADVLANISHTHTHTHTHFQ